MRVTNRMMIQSTLANISANQARLDQLQNQITSGRKLRQPSDDPVGAARALGIAADLEQIAQYERNSQSAVSWLNGTEAALGQVTSALQRARELAVTGANEVLSPAQRQNIAQEVDQIFNAVLDLGNAKQGGRFLFAGYAVLTKPFVPSATPAGFTYQGDTGLMELELEANSTVVANTAGTKVFPEALTALRDLQKALQASDMVGIRNGMSVLDSALDANLGELASVGAKIGRVEAVEERSKDRTINKRVELSAVVDLDFAEALLNFSSQQAVYQASLKAASQAIQPSLLDYLQ